jgi:hypothetical protein
MLVLVLVVTLMLLLAARLTLLLKLSLLLKLVPIGGHFGCPATSMVGQAVMVHQPMLEPSLRSVSPKVGRTRAIVGDKIPDGSLPP